MKKNKYTGAVLVEFAIVLPLLLALVLGIVEFSYGFARYNSLNKVTQEGARYFSDPLRAKDGDSAASIDVTSSNSNITSTKSLMISYDPHVLPSFLSSDIAISSPVNDHIQITSTYTHNFIVGNALSSMVSLMVGSSASFGPTITMTASAVLRVQ